MTKCYNCCGLECDGDVCPNCGHSLHDYKMPLAKVKEVLPHVEVIVNEHSGFSSVGPLRYQTEHLLSYAVNREYRDQAALHPTLAVLFCRPEDGSGYFASPDFSLVLSDDPAMDFYRFHNYLVGTGFYGQDYYPLDIDRNVFEARGITISPGVVIGVDGGRVYKGLRILHGGGVEIGNGTFIGANTVIVRGVFGGNTVIGSNCFVGNLCNIGHGAVIEDNCLILPGAILCGSCHVKEGARISPGAIVSDHITVGKGAFVTLGAVVTRDVPDGERVSGNFAIRHENWLAFVKDLAGRE